MYSSLTFEISDLVNNVLEVIKYKKGIDIKIANQFDPAFYIDIKRKAFYTSSNIDDEHEKINCNNHKIPTVYCAPRYRNLLSIHMISALSSKIQAKYRTDIFQ